MISRNDGVTSVTDYRRLCDRVMAVLGDLDEARETLRRLCLRGGVDLPSRVLAAWPDVVRSMREAYGYTPIRFRPPAPTAAAIDRLDQVLGWLLTLTGPAAKVFGARVAGLSWPQIIGYLGTSESSARRLLWSAAVTIAQAQK